MIKVLHGSMHLRRYFAGHAPEPLAGRTVGFGDIRADRAREMVARPSDLGTLIARDDIVVGAAE